MKKEYINSIISEYMNEDICKDTGMIICGRVGTSFDPSAYYLKEAYTESLDSLNDVIIKISGEGKFKFELQWYKDEWECYITDIKKLSDYEYEGNRGLGKTIPLAISKTCAKVIKNMR